MGTERTGAACDATAESGSAFAAGGALCAPPRWAWVLVLLLALLPRAVRWGERLEDPDLRSPAVDAHWHDAYARELAGTGSSWPEGFPVETVTAEPLHRPPGYPWFLSLLYRISGGSTAFALAVQHLLGLVSVALVGLVASRLAGAWAGLAAGALFGLTWLPVHFEGELHAPALLTVLSLGGLALATTPSGAAPSARRGFLAGLLFAAATLTRPNALLPGLAVAAWRARASGSRAALPLLAGLLLAPVPSLVRNLAAAGEPVPMTTAFGINLFLGQRPEARGVIDSDLGPELDHLQYRTCFDWPQVVARVEAREGQALGHAGADRVLRGRALSSMAAEPVGVLARTAVKAGLLLGAREVPHNKEIEAEQRRSASRLLAPLSFPALLALAGIGLALGPRRRLAPASCWALFWALSILPFFVAARYREPLLPVLAIPAGAGLVVLARRAREGRVWAVGLPLLALPFALDRLVTVDLGVPGVKDHLDQGRAWFRLGEHGRAQDAFDAALALQPDLPEALYERALVDLAEERWRAGAARLEQVLSARPDHPKAAANLARLLAEGRAAPDRPRAARLLAVALRGEGPVPQYLALGQPLLLGLATAPQAAARDGAAALALGEALVAACGPADGMPLALRAAALAELGRFEEAERDAAAAEVAARAAGNPGAARAAAEQRTLYARRQPLRIPGP
jgi:4-amino-4-deoxy-L-arabinose transferase-like glycosyltransferase